MNLKCVQCGDDAEFTYEGTSLCKKCLPQGLRSKIARKEAEGAINKPLKTAP